MEYRLLGPCEARVDGTAVALGGPRQRAVLAMLALAAPDVVSTDRLVDGIWGDEPPAKPLPTLQVFISNLRKALREAGAEDVLVSQRPGYRLAVDPAATDVGRFLGLHARAREAQADADPAAALALLDEALSLWRGPALADVREAPFAEAEAVRLDELRLLAEEDRFAIALQLGQHAEVVSDLQERVRLHPTRERLWGQLMTALYRSDRAADALATYASARDRLADELGIDPGEALQQLELGILRQDPALAAPVPILSSARPTPTAARPATPRTTGRVPVPTTSTFGREALVASVVATTSSPDTRVVSLTGPGGSGKSRVAALAAAEAADRHPAGVVYLAATELTDAEQLTREAARLVLGSEPDSDPLTALAESVADRSESLLLVLDNLESLPDATALVSGLVAAAPYLTVLVTSRLPLRLAAEHEVPVPPLEVPAPDAEPAAVLANPAVRLFEARARSAQPGFSVSSHLADVVALVRFLDGVPLALELAAARVRLLSAAAILEHLRGDLSLLSTTAQDVPARQQTLSATIAWSYERLDAGAQVVCDRATLFERGFTIEALEAICDDVPSVFDALSAVLDARLIRMIDSRVEVRFVVLGTVRAFARDRLLAQADLDVRRHRLAEHLATRAESWRTGLDGPDGAVVLGRFEDEADDMVAAAHWALTQGQPALAARLVIALQDVWVATGRMRDGLDLADRCRSLDLPEPQSVAVTLACGKLAYHLTDWSTAADRCREALARAEPGSALHAESACYLGGALVVTGSPDEGAALAGDAIATRPDLYPMQAVGLAILAIAAALRGDFDAERAYYRQRLEVVRLREDRARIADTLNTLAEISLDDLDATTAGLYADESLAIADRTLPVESRDALITLARARVVEGDAPRAAALVRRALTLSDRTGQTLAMAQCLRVGACLAGLEGDAAGALRLFAAAQRLCPSPSGSDEPVERDLAAHLTAARAVLGETEASRHWTAGTTLPTPSVRRGLEAMLDRLAEDVPDA